MVFVTRALDGQAFGLRPYQRETVDAFERTWSGQHRPTSLPGAQGPVNRGAAIMATGLGKTVIFSELARRAHERRERTLVLVHREELATQAAAKLHGAAPRASIGIVKAERDDWAADIVVASVPTLARSARRERIPRSRFGLVIADECHHAAATSWQSVLHWFGSFHPEMTTRTAGFTATMARGDSKALGETWSEIVAERDISFGIQNGYLVPVSGKVIRVKDLLLDEVKRSRGDWQDDDLGEAMIDANAGDAIAEAYLEHTPGRRAALFSPSVASARRFAADLVAAGVPAECITGSTTTDERRAIYRRFETGETLVISSCMVLTEGWDAPWAEVAIIARPTGSAALYVQMVGRVLRPWAPNGKRDAFVLDVVGASSRHRLSSLKDLFPASSSRDLYPDSAEVTEDSLESDELDGESPGWDDGTRDSAGGELVATDAVLFEERPSAWSRTVTAVGQPGVWFVPTREHYWFVWPQDDGTYGVGSKPVRSRAGFADVVAVERGLTLDYAMTWAERYASQEDHSISSRSSSWRRKPPSDSMLGLAAALGVPAYDTVNARPFRQGELSDLITTAKASRILPVPSR